MSFTTRHLMQTATVWEPTGNDGYGGKSFSAPVTIKVRWEDKAVVFRDNFGNELTSMAVVYTDTDITAKSYMKLGSTDATDPLTLDDVYEVRRFDKTPSLHAVTWERKVYL